jgi:CheY-like chemotaxis protein
MAEPNYTILLVDPDKRTRALLAQQLSSSGAVILQAEDGESAFKIVNERDVRLVVTELYLKTGEDDDLIHAIRRTKALRRTRALAHTLFGTAVDRDWAMRAGADAYLIKPTRAERLRYVVSRLASKGSSPSSLPATSDSPVARRDSLGVALSELEQGALKGTSSIVFGRSWWEELTVPQQSTYRKRAKHLGVSLRSDSMLGDHFVEVRGPARSDQGLSTERPESPYRR